MKRNENLQDFIDDFQYRTFGVTEHNCCVSCKKQITGFRNPLSEKEFKISGLCQECQDSVFGVD